MESFKFEPPVSPQEKQEEKEKKEDFESYIDKGIEEALNIVENQFENNDNPKENLPFHNKEHSEGVINRTESILTTIKNADPTLLTNRDIQLGQFIAANHDTVQKWEEDQIKEGNFTKIVRKRFTGNNEKESAEKAIEFMEKNPGFTDKDRKIVTEAINCTIPGFDTEKETVVQPNLNKESSLIARAVALADLGTAGMVGPDAYLPEGDALFREENLDILEALGNSNNIPEDKKEYLKERMLNWSNFQIKFAEGRRDTLEKELEGLPENVREVISSLFNKFDESIKASEEQSEKRKNMSFEELTEDMGY